MSLNFIFNIIVPILALAVVVVLLVRVIIKNRKIKAIAASLQPGTMLKDKDWGDTIIRIENVNKDGKRVRFTYQKIDGRDIANPTFYKTTAKVLIDDYEIISE